MFPRAGSAFRFCPGCHAHCFPNSRRESPRGGRTFSSREQLLAPRQQNVPDSDSENEFRRKPEFALVRSLRRFRRLFADAQSTAASKLANPLTNRRFLVLRRTTPGAARAGPGLPGWAAEIRTKPCAKGES